MPVLENGLREVPFSGYLAGILVVINERLILSAIERNGTRLDTKFD